MNVERAHLDEHLTLFQCRHLFLTHIQVISGTFAILDEDTLHLFGNGRRHGAVLVERGEARNGKTGYASCGAGGAERGLCDLGEA